MQISIWSTTNYLQLNSFANTNHEKSGSESLDDINNLHFELHIPGYNILWLIIRRKKIHEKPIQFYIKLLSVCKFVSSVDARVYLNYSVYKFVLI